MVLLSLLPTDNDAYKPLDRCLALKKRRKKKERKKEREGGEGEGERKRERKKERRSFGQLRIPIGEWMVYGNCVRRGA